MCSSSYFSNLASILPFRSNIGLLLVKRYIVLAPAHCSCVFAQTIANTETEDLALGLIAWRNELAPQGDAMVVFRDSAFPDDVAKTNITAILQQSGITNVRSL